MTFDNILRENLMQLLKGEGAHMTFKEAVRDFPMSRINDEFPNGVYSSWALLEHIRLTQWDILDYMVNPKYKAIKWPNDYWPKPDKKATSKEWRKTIASYERDLLALERMVMNKKTDIFGKVLNGGATFVREINIVVDHTAYHIGEFAIMRQVMGTWPKKR